MGRTSKEQGWRKAVNHTLMKGGGNMSDYEIIMIIIAIIGIVVTLIIEYIKK